MQPVNVDADPRAGRTSSRSCKSPPHNTVDGKHYGVSLQWGPNTLLYNTKDVTPAPTSWASIYDPKYKGKVTVPDNPIQIADAALYLSKTRPEPGHHRPVRADRRRSSTRRSNLLKQQRPLIKKYWALASDEIDLFKNGDAVVGASWPYQTITLQDATRRRSKDLIPSEGATGWADTWMLSAQREAPELRLHVDEVDLDAEGAGAAGDLVRRDAGQHEGLPVHGQTPEGLVRAVPRERAGVVLRLDQVLEDADARTAATASQDCTDYTTWQQKWTEMKG